MSNHNQLPPALTESIKNGRVVLFLGAGASMEAVDHEGNASPSGPKLAEMLHEKFLGAPASSPDLMLTADIAAQKAGASVVSEFIRTTLSKLTPSSAHMALPQFRWHTIATTNYDTLVEDAYGATSNSLQDLLPFVKDREPVETRRASVSHPLDYLKLHGCIDHAHDSEIPLVLDPAHYERFKANRDKMYNRLEAIAHELPFLFVGYKLTDPHIRNIVHRLARSGDRPEYYIVTPSPDPLQVQYWQNQRIVAIDAKFGPFMSQLDSEIPSLFRALAPPKMDQNLHIRKFFRTTSDPSERTITSLKNDLTQVHGSMPIHGKSAKEFYRGYDEGFSAIARDLDAFRRVTSDLLVDLIDEHDSNKPKILLLRGPAGAGKTIALKRTAWEVSTTFDSPVLWLEAGGILKPEVLVELSNLVGKRIYVFVDRAAERIRMLADSLSISLTRQLPITFVAAERDSTWNVTREDFDERWNTRTYQIGQLHQKEITNLLSKLELHSSLGVLAGLLPKERLKAFEEADRHLLVALHEVTEGKPFEDIVLDECKSLSPEKAKQLYLDICTLGQFDAPARAGVINRVSGIPYSMYKSSFFMPLENVVLTYQNPYGDYEYKSRHKRVSSIVFKGHFSTDEQRKNQILRIIGALDEGYKSDSIAIGNLIKAHSIRRLISDIDVGRSFYDALLKILGEQWFIWQQYAILELHHHNGSLERADELCTRAISISEGRESALHTHAEIARRRAQQASSDTEKEVYRIQSRERLAKIKFGSSSYVDASRCKLRLDEMADALSCLNPDDDDSVQQFAEKCRNAHEQIERAKHRHPDDSEFSELEAQFYEQTDEKRLARRALERAWELQPLRPTVALQLAKMHKRAGDTEAEQAILLDALDRHGTDTSLHLSAANFYLRSPDDHARAAFHFARSYNSSDRNYVARYEHAKFLFSTGDGERAATLFKEVDQLAPSEFQQRTRPTSNQSGTNSVRYSGRIEKIEDTYAFITAPCFPSNIYSNISDSSEQTWDELRRGSAVSFSVGFNRKGPFAISLESSH
jgi:TolA-binding protein